MQLHVCKSFLLQLSNPFCLKLEVQFERVDHTALVSKHKLRFQIYSWPNLSLSLPLLCKYQMETLRIFRMYCWCRSLHLLDALDTIFQRFVALGFYWSYLKFFIFRISKNLPQNWDFQFFLLPCVHLHFTETECWEGCCLIRQAQCFSSYSSMLHFL